MKLTPATEQGRTSYLAALTEWTTIPPQEMIDFLLQQPRPLLLGQYGYKRPAYIVDETHSMGPAADAVNKAVHEIYCDGLVCRDEIIEGMPPDCVIILANRPNIVDLAKQRADGGTLVIVRTRNPYTMRQDSRWKSDLLHFIDQEEEDSLVVERFLRDALFSIRSKLKCHTPQLV